MTIHGRRPRLPRGIDPVAMVITAGDWTSHAGESAIVQARRSGAAFAFLPRTAPHSTGEAFAARGAVFTGPAPENLTSEAEGAE